MATVTPYRTPRLVIATGVLAVAWYAGREGVSMGLVVALVGLAAAYWRAVLGIPVAVAMAAAAVYVPAVAVVATIVVVLLGLTSAFVKFAFDLGPVPESNVTPTDGFAGVGGGGGTDSGGFGGGF
ncbi:MAG TPA: hypothetical protein VF520_05570 [Thermoleophilaceae bacterium]|jgi:hypothetical protein